MQNFFKSPLVNVLLFSLFWALVIFTSKVAFLGGAQLIPFSIQTTFLTFIFLTIYIIITRLKELKKISAYHIKWLLIINAIYMGFGTFLSFAGVQLTSAINAGFLTQFTIVTGTFFAWLLLKEKMTLAKIVSIFTIILGSFLLITKGQLIIPHVGDLLIILACVAWGLGGVLIRGLLKNSSINPDIISFFRPIAGLILLLLLLVLSPLYPLPLQKAFHGDIFQLHQPFYVLVNALFITLDWIFVNRTLKISSASYASIIPSITPVLVTFLALMFLNETVNWIQTIGIILIIASSFIAQYLKFYDH